MPIALLALAAPFVLSFVVVVALALLGWRNRRRWGMRFYYREAAHRARVAADAERRAAEAECLMGQAT